MCRDHCLHSASSREVALECLILRQDRRNGGLHITCVCLSGPFPCFSLPLLSLQTLRTSLQRRHTTHAMADNRPRRPSSPFGLPAKTSTVQRMEQELAARQSTPTGSTPNSRSSSPSVRERFGGMYNRLERHVLGDDRDPGTALPTHHTPDPFARPSTFRAAHGGFAAQTGLPPRPSPLEPPPTRPGSASSLNGVLGPPPRRSSTPLERPPSLSPLTSPPRRSSDSRPTLPPPPKPLPFKIPDAVAPPRMLPAMSDLRDGTPPPVHSIRNPNVTPASPRPSVLEPPPISSKKRVSTSTLSPSLSSEQSITSSNTSPVVPSLRPRTKPQANPDPLQSRGKIQIPQATSLAPGTSTQENTAPAAEEPYIPPFLRQQSSASSIREAASPQIANPSPKPLGRSPIAAPSPPLTRQGVQPGKSTVTGTEDASRRDDGTSGRLPVGNAQASSLSFSLKIRSEHQNSSGTPHLSPRQYLSSSHHPRQSGDGDDGAIPPKSGTSESTEANSQADIPASENIKPHTSSTVGTTSCLLSKMLSSPTEPKMQSNESLQGFPPGLPGTSNTPYASPAIPITRRLGERPTRAPRQRPSVHGPPSQTQPSQTQSPQTQSLGHGRRNACAAAPNAPQETSVPSLGSTAASAPVLSPAAHSSGAPAQSSLEWVNELKAKLQDTVNSSSGRPIDTAASEDVDARKGKTPASDNLRHLTRLPDASSTAASSALQLGGSGSNSAKATSLLPDSFLPRRNSTRTMSSVLENEGTSALPAPHISAAAPLRDQISASLSQQDPFPNYSSSKATPKPTFLPPPPQTTLTAPTPRSKVHTQLPGPVQSPIQVVAPDNSTGKAVGDVEQGALKPPPDRISHSQEDTSAMAKQQPHAPTGYAPISGSSHNGIWSDIPADMERTVLQKGTKSAVKADTVPDKSHNASTLTGSRRSVPGGRLAASTHRLPELSSGAEMANLIAKSDDVAESRPLQIDAFNTPSPLFPEHPSLKGILKQSKSAAPSGPQSHAAQANQQQAKDDFAAQQESEASSILRQRHRRRSVFDKPLNLDIGETHSARPSSSMRPALHRSVSLSSHGRSAPLFTGEICIKCGVRRIAYFHIPWNLDGESGKPICRACERDAPRVESLMRCLKFLGEIIMDSRKRWLLILALVGAYLLAPFGFAVLHFFFTGARDALWSSGTSSASFSTTSNTSTSPALLISSLSTSLTLLHGTYLPAFSHLLAASHAVICEVDLKECNLHERPQEWTFFDGMLKRLEGQDGWSPACPSPHTDAKAACGGRDIANLGRVKKEKEMSAWLGSVRGGMMGVRVSCY